MESTPILPTVQDNEQILDFIQSRIRQSFILRDEGMIKEAEALESSAYSMASVADDPKSLGFLYASIPSSNND